MIYDLWLRWVVTALSVLSAAGWAYFIVARRRGWIFVVSYALDLAMAMAMAAMAWPWSASLPTKGPAVFFLLAAVWFAALTFMRVRAVSQRVLRAYHVPMMLGMAWMYAVSNGQILPGQSAGRQHTGGAGHVDAGHGYECAGHEHADKQLARMDHGGQLVLVGGLWDRGRRVCLPGGGKAAEAYE